MPLPENIIILFYWTAPFETVFCFKAPPDASLIGSDSALRVKIKTASFETVFYFKAPPDASLIGVRFRTSC